MPKLDILWKRHRDQKDLPYITSDTGKVLSELLQELGPALEKEGIALSFHENIIDDLSPVKPGLMMNGRSFDDLLHDVAGEQRRCEGRRWEMSLPVTFPNVNIDNESYFSVPELLIRKALLRATGII